jgi:hypothetical protein
VECERPSHFLTSRAPTGGTLLKRRHLELLNNVLVIVPYWELGGCKGAGERKQYLRGTAPDGSSAGDSQQEENLTQICCLCLNRETRGRVGQALRAAKQNKTRCASWRSNPFSARAPRALA